VRGVPACHGTVTEDAGIVSRLKPDPTYHQYQWFLAKDGGCYVYYQGDFGG
jgi:hypothetical protein